LTVPKFWLINDKNLRDMILNIEEGHISAEEAYAVLCEHAVVEPIMGVKRIRKHEDLG